MRERLAEKELDAMGDSYFKLNIPPSIDEYKNGNGEGIWAITDPESKAKLDSDCDTGQFVAYACNNSYYYPGIILIGTRVLAEYRGKNRPMAVWDDLEETEKADSYKEATLKKIMPE